MQGLNKKRENNPMHSKSADLRPQPNLILRCLLCI